APRVTEQVERVRSDLAPLVVERVGRVREDVVPQVTDAASKAASRVAEAATTGRAALKDFASGDAMGQASDFAGDLGKATQRVARDTRDAAQRGGRQVADVAGSAASATASGTKNLFLTLFWLVALGGIVLYGFLNKEQRDKVFSTANSIYAQGKELVRDFQGYDEEF
ncbi:MAG: hypothetical protein ACTHMP_20630, partial [Thermomicrobiales bacterium]